MGQYLSRARPGGGGLRRAGGSTNGHDDSDSAQIQSYVYPPKNNNGVANNGVGGNAYFASHFIMGGEKFESPQPESFLFGENSDLNFLGPKPVAFPYPPPSANEPTKTLRSLINIRRDSLHFSVVKDEGKKYRIRFTFDCDVRCAVSVEYFCRENEPFQFVSTRNELTSAVYEFPKGAKQTFDVSEHTFDPDLCKEELEKSESEDGGGGIIPVVIKCVALENFTEGPKQQHVTFATIDKIVNPSDQSVSSYSLKATKQKLFVDGLSYLLQEIYGLENKSMEFNSVSAGADGNSADDFDDDLDDCGAECVVCMCDLRDTLILPCRHLCLCNACADSLRYQANNCPICRAPFRALLQIRGVQKSVGGQAQMTHPALAANTDPDDQTVPPGYRGVSLVEALNGPPVVNPPPAAAPSNPNAAGAAIMSSAAQAAAEKKASRKSRSGQKKSSSRSSSSRNRSAPPSLDESRGEEDNHGHHQQQNHHRVINMEEEDENDDEDNDTLNNQTDENVSLSIVNEVIESPSSSTASASKSRSKSSLKKKQKQQQHLDPEAAEEEKKPLSHSGSTVDLVEEELAKMNTEDTEHENILKSEQDDISPTAATQQAEEADEAVVVNLKNGSSRISIPGPKHVSSTASSSSSSSASTKQLLPSSTKTVVVAPSSVSSAPTSAGSTVVVKVRPNNESDLEDAIPNEEEEEDLDKL